MDHVFVEALHREPPPGYCRANISQLIQCDRAAWARLDSTLPSIRQDATGQYPLGIALLGLRADPHISLYLAPLAKAQPAGQGEQWNRRPGPFEAQKEKEGARKEQGRVPKGTPRCRRIFWVSGTRRHRVSPSVSGSIHHRDAVRRALRLATGVAKGCVCVRNHGANRHTPCRTISDGHQG